MSLNKSCLWFSAIYTAAAFVSLLGWNGSLVHAAVIVLHMLFSLTLVLTIACSFVMKRSSEGTRRYIRDTAAEILLVATAVISGFLYFYALNANLDYVQRLINHSGVLQLSVDSTSERILVALQYGPFLIAGIAYYIYFRARKTWRQSADQWWALPAILISAAASALALPSGIFLEGVPGLAWVAMVPLLIVLDKVPFLTAWRHGVVWGCTYLMLTSYWLATYSLISLQTAVLIYAGYYFLSFPIIILLRYVGGRRRFLLMAAAFSIFEYLRTIGFLGYPWAMLSHSQYRFPVIFQIAEFTGIWGVALLVYSVNATVALVVSEYRIRKGSYIHRISSVMRENVLSLSIVGFFAVGTLLYGIVQTVPRSRVPSGADTIRVSLIQQNTDPRQARYDYTFNILQDLTRQALKDEPDLIVWGETAFVPNIRRWSDPDLPPGMYTGIVQKFLEFQRKSGTALLTGNDDYSIIRDSEGVEIERHHYNAAVLFAADGGRVDTYHKIRLVPFTEYFPMGDVLPFARDLLESYGVSFWEPGEQSVVFDFAGFKFSTPICFEDIFPQEVRAFVRGGADVIINLTNDYWSLDPVQAEQHYAASVFRTVENRRPMLRGTVSGKTAYVDSRGRLQATLPMYQASFLTVDLDLELDTQYTTMYTAWGDWLPIVLVMFLLGHVVYWVVKTGKTRPPERP